MLPHNSETLWLYHASYSRNARAVGLIWAICTICFCILALVAFSQPHWIANYEYGDDNELAGYFGIYKHCRAPLHGEYTCVGEISDWGTILNNWFKASLVLYGLGVIVMLLCVCCLMLFFLMKAASAYVLCGCLQFTAGAAMLAACILYPAAWDYDEVRMVCGQDAKSYSLGDCSIRWAYALAIIGVFDALFLAMLAFVLATRQPKRPDEKGLLNGGAVDLYRDEVESKASIAIHPVIAAPKAYSEYSHRRGPASRRAPSEYSYASTRREFSAL